MSYSTSLSTLELMLPHLVGIRSGQDSIIWPCTPGTTREWAYKLREARHIALSEVNPDDGLRKAFTQYRIHEHARRHQVEARRINLMVASPEASSMQSPLHLTPAKPTRQPPIPGLQTARGIISSLLTSPLQGPIHYPDAALSTEDLTLLKNWTDAQDPRLMVLQLGTSLTIAPFDAEVADVA